MTQGFTVHIAPAKIDRAADDRRFVRGRSHRRAYGQAQDETVVPGTTGIEISFADIAISVIDKGIIARATEPATQNRTNLNNKTDHEAPEQLGADV